MRALVVALLLLALVLVALPNTARATSGPCSPSTCKATIDRTISTNSWGVTIVADKITLDNTASVSNLTIGVPSSVAAHLQAYQANDTSNDLQVSRSATLNGTYTSLTILFPTLVTSYNFTLYTVYWGLLSYSTGSSSYAFMVNPFPVMDNSYSTSVTTTFTNDGGWSSPQIGPPVNSPLQGPYAVPSLKPFNTTVWTITFSAATSQNLLGVSAGRTIRITPSNS
ncbi:MAG TPA: hypothetical protein VE955_05060, partial [Candidatus Dormibacteraeota bacterium]|nr:hypothetical protein [Candidatus Dormibacteraeota bacterium]